MYAVTSSMLASLAGRASTYVHILLHNDVRCVIAAQALAAVLSNGSVAVMECIQADLWAETLESADSESAGDNTLHPGVVDVPALKEQLVR